VNHSFSIVDFLRVALLVEVDFFGCKTRDSIVNYYRIYINCTGSLGCIVQLRDTHMTLIPLMIALFAFFEI